MGVAANWLNSDFTADVPNRKRVGDISYIWTAGGWLYLAIILCLHSRRVVSWVVSGRMKKDLQSERWTWQCAWAIRRRIACSTQIAQTNIAPTTTKRSCRHMTRVRHLRQRQLLHHCVRRNILQNIEGRTHSAAEMANTASGASSHLLVH